MNPEQHRLATEIAHVLFMDMVYYSRGSMEEQARVSQELRQVVRDTPEFQWSKWNWGKGADKAVVE